MSDRKRIRGAIPVGSIEPTVLPNARDHRTGLAAFSALATVIASVSCAAELEDPGRFTAASTATGGATSGTGGTTGTTGGSTSKPVMTPPCVQTIITATCATMQCHHSTQQPATRGGLDLSGANPAQMVVDVVASYAGIQMFDPGKAGACVQGAKLIDSANPSAGVLLQRLTGTQPCGYQMPPPPTLLPADQLTCMKNWAMAPFAAANVITEGAGGSSGDEESAGKGDDGY